jgi:hypothetical protein
MAQNFFSVDAFQAHDKRRRATLAGGGAAKPLARDLSWGIEGEPYSRLNYVDLIDEIKLRDKELHSLREQVNAAKYEQMRRDMEANEELAPGARPRRHYQESRLGPLAHVDDPQLGPPLIKISGSSAPAQIGCTLERLRMPTSWPARDVVVCHFDVPSQLYTVSTDEQTYLLDDAAEILQFGDAVGQEIHLHANADLVYTALHAHPTLVLRYRSHERHYDPEQRTVARVQGKCAAVIVDPARGLIFMTRPTKDDFTEWKYVLKRYLTTVQTFPHFAPDEERQQIRKNINRLRDILLDAQRWRLDGWHYDKLCVVFEGQGWALDGRPFDHIDGQMLMNLDQESTKCLRMCAKMCRKELETRLDAFDTPAVKRIRERWTLPVVDVCAPTRPFEIMRSFRRGTNTAATQLLDTAIEGERAGCMRCANAYYAGEVRHDKKNGGAYSRVSDAVPAGEDKAFLSVRYLNARVGLHQTSHLMFVQRDSRVKGSAKVNMRGGQDEFCDEGKWFDARQVLCGVRESGPFRLLLKFASANNWIEALHTIMALKGQGHGAPAEAAAAASPGSAAALVPRGGQPQQGHPPQPRHQHQQRTPQVRWDTRELVQTPATPAHDRIRKIPVPPGGWLRSESERRIGPGTNNPKKAESGKEQRRIERAKRRRKRERKKKLKKMKRGLRRSQSEESALLPPI